MPSELRQHLAGQPGARSARLPYGRSACPGRGAARGPWRDRLATSSSNWPDSPVRSGSSSAMRNSSACTPLSAVPNGIRPVAAYASTAPRQKMSLAAVTCSPAHLLGRHEARRAHQRAGAGQSARRLHRRSRRARAMPKSMTRGPSMVIRTLDGLRSRWTSPAPWMSRRARTSPEASARDGRRGQRAVLVVDDLGERGARDVTGGDPGRLGLGVGVQHRRRPGAAHPAGGGDLLREAAPEVGLPREFVLHDLHRDGAAALANGPDTPGPCRPRPAGRAAGSRRSSVDRPR